MAMSEQHEVTFNDDGSLGLGLKERPGEKTLCLVLGLGAGGVSLFSVWWRPVVLFSCLVLSCIALLLYYLVLCVCCIVACCVVLCR